MSSWKKKSEKGKNAVDLTIGVYVYLMSIPLFVSEGRGNTPALNDLHIKTIEPMLYMFTMRSYHLLWCQHFENKISLKIYLILCVRCCTSTKMIYISDSPTLHAVVSIYTNLCKKKCLRINIFLWNLILGVLLYFRMLQHNMLYSQKYKSQSKRRAGWILM